MPVPQQPGSAADVMHQCMRKVISLRASDLHLKTGAPPYLRLNGELTPIPGMYSITTDEMQAIVSELTRGQEVRLEEFRELGESDLAYDMGRSRFRVNLYRQRGEVSAALRLISEDVPQLVDLNLPPVIDQLALSSRGLILLTGATGSGKTTTLAGMIDLINRTQARHIVTIEDPIEIVHRDHKSLVNQREVGRDTGSFSGALRRALRQDPDVILIGEMRDEETVRTALSAAETGHLVLSTLHTIDVTESIQRILDFFPANLQAQARSMLAGVLRGIISQRLVRTRDGRSRVPAVEVLVGTSRVADLILNAEKTGHIVEAVAEGSYYGMQTFDQALLQLVLDDAISIEEAMLHATSKQNFALLLEAHSVRIDSDLRRLATGSVGSPQEDLNFEQEAQRSLHPPGSTPQIPGPAPVHTPSTQAPPTPGMHPPPPPPPPPPPFGSGSAA